MLPKTYFKTNNTENFENATGGGGGCCKKLNAAP